MSRYHKILKADIGNFNGFRVSVWLSGCRRHCEGCFNPQAWPFDSGKLFDDVALKKIEKELKHEWCRGVSILGGEPLEPENLEATKDISALAKRLEKDVALWTGFYLEDLDEAQRDALRDVDYLVDGPFIEELKDTSLLWRGSSNQRIWRKVDNIWTIIDDLVQEAH